MYFYRRNSLQKFRHNLFFDLILSKKFVVHKFIRKNMNNKLILNLFQEDKIKIF